VIEKNGLRSLFGAWGGGKKLNKKERKKKRNGPPGEAITLKIRNEPRPKAVVI